MKKMEQLKGRKLFGLVLSLVLIASLVLPAVAYAVGHDNPEKQDQKRSKPAEEGDLNVLALMDEINEQLAAQELNIAVEKIEFFTIGKGRPDIRIHQQSSRWVAKDLRRDAQGDDITYLVDQSDGATASGLTKEDTEGWDLWGLRRSIPCRYNPCRLATKGILRCCRRVRRWLPHLGFLGDLYLCRPNNR
jgi:hypothetical protein